MQVNVELAASLGIPLWTEISDPLSEIIDTNILVKNIPLLVIIPQDYIASASLQVMLHKMLKVIDISTHSIKIVKLKKAVSLSECNLILKLYSPKILLLFDGSFMSYKSDNIITTYDPKYIENNPEHKREVFNTLKSISRLLTNA